MTPQEGEARLDADTLRALLARVRAATGYSPEIDADLYAIHQGWDAAHLADNGEVQRLTLESTDGNRRTYGFTCEGVGSFELPPFTDSLDDALELVGKALPRWSIHLNTSEGLKYPVVTMGRSYPTNKRVAEEHNTAPLALCAAILSALIVQAAEGATTSA